MVESGTRQDPPVEVALALILCPQSYNVPAAALGQPGVPAREPHDSAPLRILISRRPAHTVYGGYWEFPGGKAEPGETPAECARREALEEVGLAVEAVAELDPVIHTYEHATVRLVPVVCRVAEGSGPARDLGVDAHMWVGLGELPWAEFLPANVRVLTRLVRYLDAAGSG